MQVHLFLAKNSDQALREAYDTLSITLEEHHVDLKKIRAMLSKDESLVLEATQFQHKESHILDR
jgi:hypothetical protein